MLAEEIRGWHLQGMPDNCLNWEVELKKLLTAWNLEHKRTFPEDRDLFERLIQCAVPDACEVATIKPGKWWKYIVRINKTNTTLRLLECLNRMVKRCLEVPAEPLLKLRLAAPHSPILDEAVPLVEGFPSSFAEANKWDEEKQTELISAILPYTSCQFQALHDKGTREWAFAATRTRFTTQFVLYAALLDIHSRNQQWWETTRSARSFAQWLCGLNHPASGKLREIFPFLIVQDFTPVSETLARKRRHQKAKRRMKKAESFQESGQK